MSNRIIPRDQLGEIQRWQLDSLEDLEPPPVEPEPEPESQATMVDEQITHLNWPTADEIEQIQQRAHEQGMQAGHQEGREAGHQEGLVAGREEGYAAGYAQGHEQSQAELEKIRQVANALDAAMVEFETQLGEDVLKLSLAVARQLIRNALHFRPEALLVVVRDAIASLPQSGQHPQLVLHPEDATLVRSLMEEELAQLHCRIVEDRHLERGGCRIRTDSSEIDATLESRWGRAMAALGRDDAWLV